MIMRRRQIAAITTAIVGLIVAGSLYVTHGTRASQAEAAGAVSAVPVFVRTLAEQKVQLWSEFSGRLRAVDSAEIRPEVAGRITEVRFEDGQNVHAGDILFVIDPRLYEAAVARAEANLASAVSNNAYAKTELDRAGTLVRTQAISQQVYDERANASRVADAAVKGAEAALQQASLDLEHAHVRAPITGRASRVELTIGNLVQAGPGAPLLTTIVGNHSIYADFDVDEQTFIETLRDYPGGRDNERRIPVQLSVPGDKGHLYAGAIYTFDNRLDVASGTIRARAKFDNADGVLVPGMFVTIKLATGFARNELLVPDRAVGFDQSKKFVYVVGEGNKVGYRAVELGKPVQSERVVLAGLQAGDRVIVDGVQHVRPDALVAPTESAGDESAPSDAAR
jgi:multidrug efflux system membrane fusion protein